MQNRLKTTLVLLLLGMNLILVGCNRSGGTRTVTATHSEGPVYAAAQVLPLAPGQQWTMRNQYGDLTHFKILARPNYQGCEGGTFLDMYITKDTARAYWEPNIPGAWNHFILKSDSQSWRNVTNTAGAESNPWIPAFMTAQSAPIPGKPLPYFLLPPDMRIQAGQEIDIDTAYKGLVATGVDETGCLTAVNGGLPSKCCNATQDGMIEWHTKTSVVTVSTPVYSGPGVATRFCEGTGGCTYPETWFFAPGIGLVEIDSEFPPAQKRPTLYTKRID